MQIHLFKSLSWCLYFHIIMDVFDESFVLFLVNLCWCYFLQILICAISLIEQIHIRAHEEFQFLVFYVGWLQFQSFIYAFVGLFYWSLVGTFLFRKHFEESCCIVVVVGSSGEFSAFDKIFKAVTGVSKVANFELILCQYFGESIL